MNTPKIKLAKTEYVDISSLKFRDDNPRKIKKKDLRKLADDIQALPELLIRRPIIVDENNLILAGSQRVKACKLLEWEKVPVSFARDLDDKKKRQMIILDNMNRGVFDPDVLGAKWDPLELAEFGMDKRYTKIQPAEEPEIEFTTELDEESNYVVLYFNKDIDFLNVESMLGLKNVYNKTRAGKKWSNGLGRVVDGVKAIKLIQAAKPKK